ncbi:MAG: 4Fe-4S binding protein [Chitinispirillaceae bacterium]|nr:4Fe-4S binding protein [Chitinispirillaceae bacterium]
MNRRLFLTSLMQLLACAAILKSQDEMRKPVIIRTKCVGCGDCVRACPAMAISLEKGKAVIDREKCIGCRMCVVTCSFGAPRL